MFGLEPRQHGQHQAAAAQLQAKIFQQMAYNA